MKNTYLVTGGNGYVGGELVRYLLARGIAVRTTVRSMEKGRELQALGAEIVLCDLADEKSVKTAVQGIYGVYHIAAIFRTAGLPETIFHEINVLGTKRLLDASIGSGVKRFIHCSTGGVLGHVFNPPGSDQTPYNPGDMYQRSKVEGEKVALSYFRENRIRGVVLRPGMIYGPADTRNLKLFRMIARRKFFYIGAGKMNVHFIDVRDLVRAFHLAMEREDLHGQIYHIAGERAVALKEMVALISDTLHVPHPWLHLPVKPLQWLGSLCEMVCRPFGIEPPIYRRRVDFFTKNRHFDTKKAESELGFRPQRKFNEEVRDIITWYQAHDYI